MDAPVYNEGEDECVRKGGKREMGGVCGAGEAKCLGDARDGINT